MNNTAYVQTSLENASMQNELFDRQDNQNWFYKKWGINGGVPPLEAPLPDLLGTLEGHVETRLHDIRENYRRLTERMRMPHPASRPFTEQKELIESCGIYKAFKVMPKCGLLHVHNTASLSLEGLLAFLEEWNGPTIYVIRDDRAGLPGKLTYTPQLMNPAYSSVTDFFRNPANKAWLKDLLSFRSTERMEGVPYIWDEFNNIFARTSDLFENPDFYKEYHVRAFKEMIDDNIDYVELRCGFQEFKPAPGANDYAPHEVLGCTSHFLDLIQAAANAAAAYAAEKPQPDLTQTKFYKGLESAKDPAVWKSKIEKMFKNRPPFKVRVILNARRDLDPLYNPADRLKLLRKVDSAILWKQMPRYKDLIIGFDFVNEEDRGNHTYAFYHKVIYGKAFYDCTEDPAPAAENNAAGPLQLTEQPYRPNPDGVNLPGNALDRSIQSFLDSPTLRIQLIDFFLHDGESIWADNDNITDAVIACRRRIGHGFNMAKFPAVTDHISGLQTLTATDTQSQGLTGTMLEICPISNQLLRYFSDLRNHTAYELMKRGIQCVISSDDPQLLCNPGLSYDFWETFVGLQLNLSAIKGLVFNAYVSRFISDKQVNEPNYPGITLGDYNTLIQNFNTLYWEPFIILADNVLP